MTGIKSIRLDRQNNSGGHLLGLLCSCILNEKPHHLRIKMKVQNVSEFTWTIVLFKLSRDEKPSYFAIQNMIVVTN